MKIIVVLILMFSISCTYKLRQGFRYQNETSSVDRLFYFPLESKMKTKDKWMLSHLSEELLKIGQENLSLEPLEKETYRYTFFTSCGEPVVVKITEDSVVIKNGYNGIDTVSVLNYMKLNKKEEKIIRLWSDAQSYQSRMEDLKQKKDNSHQLAVFTEMYTNTMGSLRKVYPNVSNTAYFDHLNKLSLERTYHQHKATIIRRAIKKNEFDQLLFEFNYRKFWRLKNYRESNEPPPSLGCSAELIEANTKEGFYFVYDLEDNNFLSLYGLFRRLAGLKNSDLSFTRPIY